MTAVNRLLLTALAVIAIAGAGPAEPFPRTTHLEPSEANKSFRVQGGFRLELLAAEPKVTGPVAAAYDEDGRLYVVEMTDYPHVDAKKDKPFAESTDPPVGRVLLLIDGDGDGVFDRSVVFADKLSWPTGVAVWKGGVFVAATPDIWYFRDNDGDLKADECRQKDAVAQCKAKELRLLRHGHAGGRSSDRDRLQADHLAHDTANRVRGSDQHRVEAEPAGADYLERAEESIG